MPQIRRSTADEDIGPILSALSVERRRRAIEYVLAADERTATLSAVADHVSERRDDADAESRDRTLTRLHHIDLPVLDAAGLLSYDAPESTVWIGERATEGRPSEMPSDVDSWDDLIDRLRTLSRR